MPDRYVDVEGGRLAVHEFGRPDAPVVLAAHGITANALSFAALARSMPDVRIIAPDLRGRACSRDITGPWAIWQHAIDLIAVADAYGLGARPAVRDTRWARSWRRWPRRAVPIGSSGWCWSTAAWRSRPRPARTWTHCSRRSSVRR